MKKQMEGGREGMGAVEYTAMRSAALEYSAAYSRMRDESTD